jgi:hypothetical protein
MKIIRTFVLFFVAGCGSGVAPVIDALNMPATAQVGADGYYDLNGQLSFHDDGGLVSVLRIAVPLTRGSYDFAVPQPLAKGTVAVEVRLDALTPKGPLEYEVSILDGGGHSSAVRVESVTLE